MIRDVNTDLVAGLLGLVLTGVFWYSIDPEIMRLSIMFPKAMIAIMGLISAGLVIRGFTKAAEHADIFSVGGNLRVVVTGGLFFAWAIAISYLGFFVSSVLAIAGMALYLASARRRVGLPQIGSWTVIALAVVTFFYLIFTRILHVPLPKGWFF
ncbi:MAG: tripartite tricarboxylate transporter TctB family protein [Desulfobacterales bacterium]